MHMKQISVIIPTYNRELSIVKSVESVLNQTYPVQEVIVVDDGSKDNTEEVVRQIKDGRVKYYKTPENHGAGAARNYGVKQARCEWIAFHDSDDEWLPGKLEKQVAYIEGYPEVGLVYTAFTICVDSQEYIFPQQFSTGSKEYEGDLLRKLLIRNTVSTQTILMRKQIFEEMNGFDEDMNALEDWEFAIRVAIKYSIGFVSEPCVRVSTNGNRMSSSLSKHYINNCYIIRKHLNTYIRENLLDSVVEEMLRMAEQEGIKDVVAKMLLLYIQGGK